MKKKISIIIPVYNTQKYLVSCLDSVLCQTFTDFEVLLVDDGSTDDSRTICDDYMVKDSRVHVYHQSNSGVSAARNLALSKACGDWVCFIDSDDVVLPDYLQDMVSTIIDDDCLVMANISDTRMAGIIHNNILLSGETMYQYVLRNSILNLSGPVAKLFNRHILLTDKIQFPTGIQYGEDMLFLLQYLNHIKTLILRKDINYIVSFRQGSLSTRLFSYESEYRCFTACLHELTIFASRLSVTPEEQEELIWRNKVSDAFLRCPKCLYSNDVRYSWKEKIRLLRAIPQEYYHLFGKWFRPQGFTSWCVSVMVAKRWFFLLLVVGHCFSKYTDYSLNRCLRCRK